MGRLDEAKGIGEATDIFRRLADRPDVECSLHGYYWPGDGRSRALHAELLTEKGFRYVGREWGGWTPQVEHDVAETLRETDVLLLPYRTLSTTIDMPLLLLEGMASLCAVVTRRVGDIPEVYGESPFLVPAGEYVGGALRLIARAPDLLQAERRRLAIQNQRWDFRTATVARLLVEGAGIGELRL
jgi:glycosyltransferase involved in cell wall biosynthesis